MTGPKVAMPSWSGVACCPLAPCDVIRQRPTTARSRRGLHVFPRANPCVQPILLQKPNSVCPDIASMNLLSPLSSPTIRNHTRFNRVWCSGNIDDSHFQSDKASSAPGSTPGIRVLMFFFFPATLLGWTHCFLVVYELGRGCLSIRGSVGLR